MLLSIYTHLAEARVNTGSGVKITFGSYYLPRLSGNVVLWIFILPSLIKFFPFLAPFTPQMTTVSLLPLCRGPSAAQYHCAVQWIWGLLHSGPAWLASVWCCRQLCFVAEWAVPLKDDEEQKRKEGMERRRVEWKRENAGECWKKIKAKGGRMWKQRWGVD